MKISTSFNLDERLIQLLGDCENRSKLVEGLLAIHFAVELNWVPGFIHEVGEELQNMGYTVRYNAAGNFSLAGNHEDDYALLVRPDGSRNIYEVFVTRGERDLKVRVSCASSARKVRELYAKVFENEFNNKPIWSFEDKLTHQGIQKKYSVSKEKPTVDMVVTDIVELLKIDFLKYQ